MTSTERDGESARRHVVLHPRTASARRVDHLRPSGGRVRGYPAETDEVLEYMRAQRRNAMWIFGPATAVVVCVFVVSLFSDGFTSTRWGDVPVFWLVLGPGILFGLLLASVVGERRTLRIERRWAEEHDR